MIDFHSHVLPNVDDGSRSPEETVKMLKLAYEQGVRHMVATPHFYATEMLPDTFLEKRRRGLERIPLQEGMPVLHVGAEVAYFDSMSRSEALEQLQIDNTGLLLVEMPFGPWTDRIVDDVCHIQERLGLTPVLAHVERYRDRDQFPKYREKLRYEGVLMQANAGSFGGFRITMWLLKQLKNGYIHFLGSDSHNLNSRPPNMELAARVIEKRLGADVLQEMMDMSYEALNL